MDDEILKSHGVMYLVLADMQLQKEPGEFGAFCEYSDAESCVLALATNPQVTGARIVSIELENAGCCHCHREEPHCDQS